MSSLSTLHTSCTNQIELRALTYNVDMAMREQKVEMTKWGKRSARVRALVLDANPDFCCLQELRKLPGENPITEFLSSFTGYDFEYGYRNSNELSFGQAILFKPSKLYPMEISKKWLSDTPDTVSDTYSSDRQVGYLVLGVKFYHVVDGKIVTNKDPFWVFNTHYGLDEDLKTKSCHALLKIIKSVAKDTSFFLSGDFNFFPDRDGGLQRSVLTSEFDDLAKGAVTLGGKHVEGTFVGFDHDEFKADLNNMVSRLDHIFGKGLNASNPILYTKTMLDVEPPELTTRDYPSDHLPLLITLNF